jgi:flavin-binding protein dodecin
MAESVYKVIELVGTSSSSWEKAVAAAVKMASQSLRDLRIAEVSDLDVQIVDGKIHAYRAKVKVSFKYTPGGGGDNGEAPAKKAPRAKAAPEAAPEAAPAKKASRRRGKRV